jgi:uncharacterized protein
MVRIGLLSDTHGYMDEAILAHLGSCDEIWHAGDFGGHAVAEKLSRIKPLRAVYGNIDGQDIRQLYPLHLRFKCEELDVWITHIGGYPGKYHPAIRKTIESDPPGLFITGHSHILKVMSDQKLKLLHINPGAAGKEGFHQVRTLVRFSVTGKRIHDLEVVEMPRW